MLRRQHGAGAAQAGRVVRLIEYAAHLGGLSCEEAEAELFLPLTLGAWGPPAAPRPAPGGGWLCCELGAPGDEEAFARLLETLPDDATAPEIAAAAQQWRLPVNEYRPKTSKPLQDCASAPFGRFAHHAGTSWRGFGSRRHPERGGPDDVRVVDMTVMWAGPLATRKLAELGAEVVKVEPACRVDGTRGTAMYDALNAGKLRVDLDLRVAEQRDEFMALVATADVVIDNFSPRVMPNLGLTHAELLTANPRIVTVSMPAFPVASPWRDRVSYGVGVHALSGLGDTGDGETFVAPPVAYADALAGLAAFATVVDLLECGGPAHAEVAMLDVLQPLL